jgi:hypothetical protein
VAGCGVESMAAKTPGWRTGVKPRSRGAVRLFPQGFTRDDGPGEDEWWRFSFVSRRRKPPLVSDGSRGVYGASSWRTSENERK